MQNLYKTVLVAMMAGANFVRTSAGKETESVTAGDALRRSSLMREELGRAWLKPELVSFGTSGPLGDIEQHTSGRYAALYRQPLA